MTLQPLPSEFPYIREKFNFFFISVVDLLDSQRQAAVLAAAQSGEGRGWRGQDRI
jgi:hypothetical protein